MYFFYNFSKTNNWYRQQSEKQINTRVYKYPSITAAPKTPERRIREKKNDESTRTKNCATAVDGYFDGEWYRGKSKPR